VLILLLQMLLMVHLRHVSVLIFPGRSTEIQMIGERITVSMC
jgi:hypothetical protein